MSLGGCARGEHFRVCQVWEWSWRFCRTAYLSNNWGMPQEYIFRDVCREEGVTHWLQFIPQCQSAETRAGLGVVTSAFGGTQHLCSCQVNEPRQRRRESLSLLWWLGGCKISKASKTLEGKEGGDSWDTEGHKEELKFQGWSFLVWFICVLCNYCQFCNHSLTPWAFVIRCISGLFLKLIQANPASTKYTLLSKVAGNQRKWFSSLYLFVACELRLICHF